MKKSKTLPLIYLISMPAIIVIANLVTNFHIEVLNEKLYISACFYPLLYLISGLIIRKTNYKDALRMMIVTLTTATLAFVIQWVIFNEINAEVAVYSFLSFLICELIFVYVYDFLLKMKKDDYLPIFLLFLLITLIDNTFFGAFVEGTLNSSTMLIRAIYLLILPATLCKPIFAMGKVNQVPVKETTVSKEKEETSKEEAPTKAKTATRKTATKAKTTTRKAATTKAKTTTRKAATTKAKARTTSKKKTENK